MLAPTRLETERLVLRLPTLADAPVLQGLASDRAIADTMISVPHPYPDGEAARYIARRLAERQGGSASPFVIERKADQQLCGVIELRDIELDHYQGELSFWLAADAWGQGYMSEAVKSVVQTGFETLGLNRLYAYHMERNPGSGRVLQKNGFVREGVLRQRVYKWGVFENTVLWAMLRQDWLPPAPRSAD
jgi:[ribosomal protein S5]-alanine N-acetyltransferase